MPDSLLLRMDAGPRIGIGHVMRGLALAQAWHRRGGEVHMATSLLHVPALAERLVQEGVILHQVESSSGSLEDAEGLAQLAEKVGSPGAVIDGYSFGLGFSERFHHSGLRLMRIDDAPLVEVLGSDQVVNPNLYMPHRSLVTRTGQAEIFMGPRYALLREEFLVPPQRIAKAEAIRILVTLGGSDPAGVTDLIIHALARIDLPLDVRVILGPAREGEVPGSAIEGQVTVLSDVQDMAVQMAWADLAIAGAGVACTELARCGVPVLALVQAVNQVPVAAAVDRLGLGWNLGWERDEATLARTIGALARDPELRASMASLGPRLVDGKGALRVARAWDIGGIHLRPVTADDGERLFVWANDPETRSMSFAPEPIPWETHLAWLQHRLAEPDHRFFIAEDLHGRCLGQVRFQTLSTHEIISVGIDPQARGRGWGPRIIAKACDSLPPGSTVAAYIKLENKASHRAFEKAGFGPPVLTEWEGHRAMRMDFMEEGV